MSSPPARPALQAELRKIQREEKEYDVLRQNVDTLLKLDIESIKEREVELQ